MKAIPRDDGQRLRNLFSFPFLVTQLGLIEHVVNFAVERTLFLQYEKLHSSWMFNNIVRWYICFYCDFFDSVLFCKKSFEFFIIIWTTIGSEKEAKEKKF